MSNQKPMPTDVDSWARNLTDQYTNHINNKRSEALTLRTRNLSLDSPSNTLSKGIFTPDLKSTTKPSKSSSSTSSAITSSSSSTPRLSSRGTSSSSTQGLRKSKSKYALNMSNKEPEVGPDGLPGYSARSSARVPLPPSDPKSIKFQSILNQISLTPQQYENPGLLDEALAALPLNRLHAEAEEENQILQVEAESLGKPKAKWGYQDCLIIALLKWFKRDFFSFVGNPPCQRCYAERRPYETKLVGPVLPTPEEKARGASRVELYQCKSDQCHNQERFPRYNDVWTVMQERKGRCGEWTNAFSMLCRALGSRVRWVWNSEDHVFTEVFSEHAGRWVHADVCEEVWDQPRLYTEGWGKKIGYCIAFSHDGATDVTRRYVRSPRRHGMPRTKCPENVLLWILKEIRAKKRAHLNPSDIKRLEKEDRDEEKELRGFELQGMLADGLISSSSTSKDGERRPRQSGTTDWKRRRGESGIDASEETTELSEYPRQ